MIESYTLTLPKGGMDAVLAGLSELPYKVAQPIRDEALRQFIEQEAAAGIEPLPDPEPAVVAMAPGHEQDGASGD
ncbi:hypothetical protein [Paraburkholderia youngii]|uniref:hypothetical protein n=1 Tax=Paraburkholderia youngii TaxID=2782701 RepID=UPI001591B7BB|nr:hypothetical protein [Paraburkholderia youngii]NUX58650.1 hypothetical protein [Paraburkholderia youngii]